MATPADFRIERYHVDLTAGDVRHEQLRCADLEDALGGIARGFKVLESRPVEDAYAPEATLMMSLGLLTGGPVMTALRTFFQAYSPLKASLTGRPAPLWSAGSGKFGANLRALGIDDVLFTGRAAGPTLVSISPGGEGAPARFAFRRADDLVGLSVNEKIQALHQRFPRAHFAVIGPAGEHFDAVRYAAIGLSTENQLASGEPKARYCGRGGMGGVLGSKNVLAIVANTPDAPRRPAPAGLKPINVEIARGDGSARFRDADKGGRGGTWANCEALQPSHALPEMNFVPTGGDESVPLFRSNVESGPFTVVDESCYRCGIRCHKNVYDEEPDGTRGAFRAKLDYEPLVLLSSNLGIFDADQACTLVQLADELGLDAISCGVTLSFAMEWNRRHAEDGPRLADGLSYGDFAAAQQALVAIAGGRLPDLGQGVKRLAEQLGADAHDFAMQSKGIEYPAYLPQTNPGYPFALAGGHMSLRTYLLLVFERETGLEYWVDAITRRGPGILRDDLTGLCKFAMLDDETAAAAIRTATGLHVTAEDLDAAVLRTHLRGYACERRQGFTDEDYAMPADVHEHHEQIDLPHFNTPEFFLALRTRVLARLDELARAQGLLT